jgi:hypothetical protein
MEKLPQSSEGSAELIKSAKNFDELSKHYLVQIGGIQGSSKYYETSELQRLINEVRRGTKTIDYITNATGLRDKVAELLVSDPLK